MTRIILNYAILAGLIYGAGEFLGWPVLENLGYAIRATFWDWAPRVGIPMDQAEIWWGWVASKFPAGFPVWGIILTLLCGLSLALRAFVTLPMGKIIGRALKGALWALKLIVLIPYALIRRKMLVRRSPFGKAKWAKLRDLKREGLLKSGGLFLGQFRKSWRYRYDLFHHGDGHFITIAGTGGGKTTACLIPPLLTAKSGSFIVTDPKGQISAITRRYRATKGRVFFLNPFYADFAAATGLDYQDSGFNPFDMIENGENTLAQSDILAKFLLAPDGKAGRSFFDLEAASFLSLFIAWVARHEPPENRNLCHLYRLMHDSPEMTLQHMLHVNDEQLMGGAFKYLSLFKNMAAAAQWQGVVNTADQALTRYVPGTPLGRHVEKSGFDPALLKSEDVTVYVILPSQHIRTGSQWLNMVLGMLGDAVGRPGKSRPVTMLLDELPNLGFLPDLRAQMRQFREYGLRMWLFSQTVGALRDIYGPDGIEDIFGLCDTMQFFAIREFKQAEAVSKMVGDMARLNRSQSTANEQDSISTVGVPLISANEILRLPKTQQIIIRRGLPIKARLIPYFKRWGWRRRTERNPYR